jgi:glycosyltransferase involved in cell wall biosynthesis
MRICFLKHSMNPGGAERTVAYLSNYFVKQGIDVDLLLYGERGFYELDERINIEYISESNKRKNIFQRIKLVLKRFINLRKYVKKNKPDIIFCMLSPAVFYALPFKRKTIIITSERSNPRNLKSKWKIFIRKFLFKKADGVVFQTERAKNFYRDIIKDKGVVIPNAIGNEYVYKVPMTEEREDKISAMGRIANEKDYPTLLKAFSIVTERHPQFILEIFGGGSAEKLLELAQELGIREKVFFKGAHPDALLKIADSKCYVLSSISEGMPNALMEAMAIGLPCVSTDCPNGPAELIEDGVNGLLVPVGDEKAMAKAILKMIEDEEFAKKCGENAAKIKETHSVEINAKRYLDYFVKLNNHKKNRRIK